MRGLTRIVVLTIATVLAGGLATAPAQAAGAVVIYKVRYDSPGSDTGNNVSLNAEFRNDGNDRYWGSDWYVWNNTGDTAKLRRKNGTLADKCSWGDGDGVKNC